MVADGGNRTWTTETGKVHIWQEVADGENRVWKAMRIEVVRIGMNGTGGGTLAVLEGSRGRTKDDPALLIAKKMSEEDENTGSAAHTLRVVDGTKGGMFGIPMKDAIALRKGR
jgi:hypothetical protein